MVRLGAGARRQVSGAANAARGLATSSSAALRSVLRPAELLEGLRRGHARVPCVPGPRAAGGFRPWGIGGTGDFGRIVFNRTEINRRGKTDHADLRDFDDVFDLQAALTDVEMCVSVGG